MDEEQDEGSGAIVRTKSTFCVFVSNVLSIWTYRNKATVNKEPLFATNVVKVL